MLEAMNEKTDGLGFRLGSVITRLTEVEERLTKLEAQAGVVAPSPTTASALPTADTKVNLLDVGEEVGPRPMAFTTAPTPRSQPHLGQQIEDVCIHVAQCSDCKDQLVRGMLSFGTLVLDVHGNQLPSILANLGSPSSAGISGSAAAMSGFESNERPANEY